MRLHNIFANTATLLALSMALSGLPADTSSADTLVASWNVEHLGWDNGKDIRSLAHVASAFDLLALQEVMSQEGLDALEREMEHVTGVDWQTMSSEAIGRGSYRERYAFIWRPDEVEWIDGAIVYIDDRDAFAREPMSMRFRTADNFEFVLASVHLIYGDSVDVREFEASALASYNAWLTETFEGSPIFIAGDFNLPPSNGAWQDLGLTSAPLITQGATTLSPINDRFANLYDNIWAPAGTPLPVAAAGIMNYPDELGMTHEQARDRVSDHAPVWMLLDPYAEPVTFAAHEPEDGAEKPASSPSSGESSLGVIRGNRNSKIYHLKSCPGFDRMSAKNIIPFTTQAEALAAGYRMARNCD